MGLQHFKELNGAGRPSGRVVVAKAEHTLPPALEGHAWHEDRDARADNQLTAQALRDGFVLGVVKL